MRLEKQNLDTFTGLTIIAYWHVVAQIKTAHGSELHSYITIDNQLAGFLMPLASSTGPSFPSGCARSYAPTGDHNYQFLGIHILYMSMEAKFPKFSP